MEKKARKTRVFICGPMADLLDERGWLYVNSRFLNVHDTAYRSHPGSVIYNPMRICRTDWSRMHCLLVCLYYLLRSDIVYVMMDYSLGGDSRLWHKLADKLKKTIVYVNA